MELITSNAEESILSIMKAFSTAMQFNNFKKPGDEERFRKQFLRDYLKKNSTNLAAMTGPELLGIIIKSIEIFSKETKPQYSLPHCRQQELLKRALQKLFPKNQEPEDLGIDNLVSIEDEPTDCPDCTELQRLIDHLRKTMETLLCPICQQTGGRHLGGCKNLNDLLTPEKKD